MVVVAHESLTGPNAVTIDFVFEEPCDGLAARHVSMGATREVA